LKNLIVSLQKHNDLQHISLLQGTKAYGAHRHPIPIPAKEYFPRDSHPNFYWLQEDFIRATGINFTIFRPQIVFGDVVGVSMNLIPVIGVYAALCRELNYPFAFPGGGEYALEAVDSRLLAKAFYWAAETPAAHNEIFNITNG